MQKYLNDKSQPKVGPKCQTKKKISIRNIIKDFGLFQIVYSFRQPSRKDVQWSLKGISASF